MKIIPPKIEIDTHGLTVDQAITRVSGVISKAPEGTYRIKVIHGYNSGTRIKSAIKREFGYGLETKVLRIIPGENEGITELVLREY